MDIIVLTSTHEYNLKIFEQNDDFPFEVAIDHMTRLMSQSTLLLLLFLMVVTMGKKSKLRQNKSNTLAVDSRSSKCVCGNSFTM